MQKNLKDMFNELIKESSQNETKYKDYKRQLVEIDILDESIKKSDLDIFLNSNTLNSYSNVIKLKISSILIFFLILKEFAWNIETS